MTEPVPPNVPPQKVADRPQPRPGRPAQLTDDLRDKIVRVVRAGNYLKTAAQYNGVGESTLRLWLTRGRKAAEARDKHPTGHRYCPDCDHDRTEEMAEVDAINAATDAPDGDPNQPTSYAVADRCPGTLFPSGARCRSEEPPREWEVPELEVPYLVFLEAITVAQTSAEVAAVTHWRAAFADDWRAARDFLRAINPSAWAATTRVAISQEEADRRIDAATEQVLVAVGVDTDALDEGHLADGELPMVLGDDEDDDGNQHID